MLRPLIPLFLCMIAGACSLTPTGEPILNTFGHDPVALIRDGQEILGNAELSAEFSNHRYVFASAENREEFLANPSSYQIQLGGGCGRMGALSGRGRMDLFAVHEDRLYVFASEQCRDTFLKNPSLVLEPLAEAAPTSTTESRARGRELIDLAVQWVGGAEALDRAVVEISRDQMVEWQGSQNRQVELVRYAGNGSMLDSYTWQSDTWSQHLSADGGSLREPGIADRAMDPSQLAAMRRKLHTHVIALLQARNHWGFLATSDQTKVGEHAERVQVWYQGMNHELHIDPVGGVIRVHSFIGWGPEMTVGKLQRTFTEWVDDGGLMVPSAWTMRFNGQSSRPTGLVSDGFRVTVAKN